MFDCLLNIEEAILHMILNEHAHTHSTHTPTHTYINIHLHLVSKFVVRDAF